MIPSFDCRLNRNFNQFFFVDDLIIVIEASRVVTTNSNFCLSIYKDLTGQSLNLIYFFPLGVTRKLLMLLKESWA